MTWLPSIALRPSFDTTNLSWSVLRNSQNALLPATASDANYGLLNDISPSDGSSFSWLFMHTEGETQNTMPNHTQRRYGF